MGLRFVRLNIERVIIGTFRASKHRKGYFRDVSCDLRAIDKHMSIHLHFETEKDE